jgi:hypothetical protein
MPKQTVVRLEILSGWKDIANYMGKGVRTVQRYERELNLPVRRPAGKSIGAVMATKGEIDAWVAASPIREAYRLTRSSEDSVARLKEFRLRVEEFHRLREEAAQLNGEVRRSFALLQANLAALLEQQIVPFSSEGRVVDMLTFDQAQKNVH